MGKHTVQSSQFDFSNGLPECLRSAQQNPSKNLRQDGKNNDDNDTSFNDFQLALDNKQSSEQNIEELTANKNNKTHTD